MLYFEDIVEGETLRYGTYTPTREEAIAFASQYDPQSFHLSDDGVEGTPFERLALSGWHVGSISMRLFADHYLSKYDSRTGLGLDGLRWLKPVYPGDTLSCELTILEKRLSRSRPGEGIVRYHTRVLNQDRDQVMDLTSTGIVGCRPDPTD